MNSIFKEHLKFINALISAMSILIRCEVTIMHTQAHCGIHHILILSDAWMRHWARDLSLSTQSVQIKLWIHTIGKWNI